ncbi:MAG: SGNH/GDSL hydrolase family protein [Planctomycetota bacterium]
MHARIALLVALLCIPAAAGREEADAPAPPLDGKRKTFVVVGYSTSFRWPSLLQQLLDGHARKKGVYHVVNASVGGSPVAKWLGLTSPRDRVRTFGRMVKGWFEPGSRLAGRPKPTVALCQQSLQWVFGDRAAGIRGPKDTERIRKGADAFAKLARQIHDLGVGTVWISTHIYKFGMEPAMENEKYALQELVRRKVEYVRAGPDVWTPTRKGWPGLFAADRIHPNALGARVMAVAWYRALAGPDVREDLIRRLEAQETPKRGGR